MGQWRRVVPHGELSGTVVMAICCGAFLLVVAVLAVAKADRVTSWSGVAFAFVFLGGLTTLAWRAARAGVHIGPQGVLLYHATKRAEVVPWNEVVSFEAHPLRLAGVREKSAAIYLVGPLGNRRETALRQSVGYRHQPADWWRFAVALPATDFVTAVNRLNEAVRPFTSPH
ncbi:hypothetical protein ACQPZF_03715 [Actinosynnema sp. CS-041913]|uniref:hypothetical protein n=1 Tax=Actinosynnema sp. CS-041913 TaxID=3239917 RepID=UPI003D90C873